MQEGAVFVERFAKFWSDPDPDVVPSLITEDVRSRWSGSDGEITGSATYKAQIAAVLAAIPDLRLAVVESLTEGDLVFIEWLAHGTVAGDEVEFHGIDR